ncbi:LOW QUALITY PROTEIN: olfactory receptor 2K2-like [Gastrophryne carolinensis]
MENNLSSPELHIMPFFLKGDKTVFIVSFVFFSLIYFIGQLMNIIIIIVICSDPHLHSPMYLFLCNLSVSDMFYTTVTVPKLLYILVSGDGTISFTQCLIQMYFLFIAASAEVTVIFVMAYDRYVAICHPLYYNSILTKKKCNIFMALIWISACVNASLMAKSIFNMIFCSSTIHQFFCEAKALFNISCGGSDMFYALVFANSLVLGFCPTICNLISYIKIIRVILSITSKDGRGKAFSTCSSHLTVMVMYYGFGISVYMIPPSEDYHIVEQILTVLYTTVIPMLNPLIYSLRNQELICALQKLVVSHVAS